MRPDGRGDAARPGLAAPRRSTRLPAPRWRPSRSASCTPGATRRMSSGGRGGARPVAASLCHHLERRAAARSRSSSASPPPSPTPRSARSIRDLSAPARDAAAGGRLRRPLLVILSHGGVVTVDEAIRLAPGTALSGPAGASPPRWRWRGRGRRATCIAFDMGGTSTDIALIRGGAAALASGREVGGDARSPCPAWTSSRSARAAGRSRRRPPAGCCRSARKAPAPIPGRPATAAAAPSRP